jgi:hypothetical protein
MVKISTRTEHLAITLSLKKELLKLDFSEENQNKELFWSFIAVGQLWRKVVAFQSRIKN